MLRPIRRGSYLQRDRHIFPQSPGENRGAFNQSVQQIARRILAGDTVYVGIVPRYRPGETRLYEILYQVVLMATL
ncbi:MAG: hypothetical protein R3B84_15180 [Zavarzinella sp.]